MKPVIMMVTDRRGTPGALPERVAAAARAGVHLIQIREPDLDAREYVDLTAACMQAVRGTAARVIVNDRMDVAIAAHASGVHLRADSITASRARVLLPAPFLVGRSIHDIAELEHGDATDYVLFGTVFATASKPGRVPAGVAALAGVVAKTTVPVLGIGGVTIGRVGEIAGAGAAGFAAIALFRDATIEQLPDTIARACAAWARGGERG